MRVWKRSASRTGLTAQIARSRRHEVAIKVKSHFASHSRRSSNAQPARLQTPMIDGAACRQSTRVADSERLPIVLCNALLILFSAADAAVATRCGNEKMR
jgi:hypothetical protein